MQYLTIVKLEHRLVFISLNVDLDFFKNINICDIKLGCY